MLNEIVEQYAFVSKLEVSDIEASVTWYNSKLDLVQDPRYPTGPWRQMMMPGVNRVSIGLWQSKSPAGSGGATETFVVANIQNSRNELIQRGVNVGPIQDVGEGVLLCFFKDPDGNSLGLRQDSMF